MPESLQQMVDRMTAGMEVTVTFGNVVLPNGRTSEPFAIRGEVWNNMGILNVGPAPVRYGHGGYNHRITAIDMPDPECPFEMGARVVSLQTGNQYIVDGWEWSDGLGCWAVKVPSGNRIEPGYLRLAPPEPAEHDHKGFSEEKCVRCGWVMGRAPLNCMNDNTPHVFPSQQQKASDRCERVEPAEPDCPAILVTYTDGKFCAYGRLDGLYAAISLKRWLTRPDIATVQALRPAEYLRGGQ